MMARGKTKGKRGKRPAHFAKEIGYLARCKNAGQRKAFLRKTCKRKGLQTAVQRGCTQVLQRGGQLPPSIRRKLNAQRSKLVRGSRSQRGAGQLLQQGGSFLADLWKGVKQLVGL